MILNRRVVITGLGVVSPLGIGLDVFWNNALKGKSVIAPSEKLKNSFFEDYPVGGINDFDPLNYLSTRQIKKLDRFTQYALVATQEALDNSRLDLKNMNKERIGIYVGNQFGGWEFTERELRSLHCLGASLMNPYLATAWFPAAPQGEISIAHGFKGHSKTIDSGLTSGLVSIAQAAYAIQIGRLDYAVAGGAEAMLTPFMMTANELLKKEQSNCMISAEGAGFVILESLESAINRKATIYGEIKGKNYFHQIIDDTIFEALKEANIIPSEIQCVIANNVEAYFDEGDEMCALANILNTSSENQIYITTPKSMFGHMQGAAGAIDVIIAALSLKEQKILPTNNQDDFIHNFGFHLAVNQPVNTSIQNILIHNRDSKSGSAAMVIGCLS